MLVCLDTHILIWGVKEENEPGQEEMIPKAKNFLRHLDKNKIQVMIPSIVLGEVLMPVQPEKQELILRLCQSKFMVMPYDAKAAVTYAKIWQAKKDDGTINELRESGNVKRVLKADCMIVATAVSRNATIIYSNDGDLAKFGEGFIKVEEMPEILSQQGFDFNNQ